MRAGITFSGPSVQNPFHFTANTRHVILWFRCINAPRRFTNWCFPFWNIKLARLIYWFFMLITRLLSWSAGMSTPNDNVINGQLDLSMKGGMHHVNDDLDDDSDDDKDLDGELVLFLHYIPSSMHWNGNIVQTKLSLLAAPEVVIFSTSDATSGENFFQMTTYLFQCFVYLVSSSSLDSSVPCHAVSFWSYFLTFMSLYLSS